jgi:hypothetical protein
VANFSMRWFGGQIFMSQKDIKKNMKKIFLKWRIFLKTCEVHKNENI